MHVIKCLIADKKYENALPCKRNKSISIFQMWNHLIHFAFFILNTFSGDYKQSTTFQHTLNYLYFDLNVSLKYVFDEEKISQNDLFK